MERRLKRRELREAQGMTQRQVAREMGVTPGAVAKWELGSNRPTLDNLLALSALFGCTMDMLCGRDISDAAQAG